MLHLLAIYKSYTTINHMHFQLKKKKQIRSGSNINRQINEKNRKLLDLQEQLVDHEAEQ